MDRGDKAGAGQRSGVSTKVKLQEAWQSTLGRFATTEEGSHNLVSRLVDLGKLTREEGRSLMIEWRQSIENNRRLLERRVDAAMARSLATITLPSSADLRQLSEQIGALEKRVHKLVEERTARSH